MAFILRTLRSFFDWLTTPSSLLSAKDRDQAVSHQWLVIVAFLSQLPILLLPSFRTPVAVSRSLFAWSLQIPLLISGRTRYFRVGYRLAIIIWCVGTLNDLMMGLQNNTPGFEFQGAFLQFIAVAFIVTSFVLPGIECLVGLILLVVVSCLTPLFYGMSPHVVITAFNDQMFVVALLVTKAVAHQHTIDKLLRIGNDLEIARDEALRASKLKSNFVAMMSHEIRTPLNSIVGFSQFLLDSPLSPEQQQWVETVQTGSRLLLSLSGQVLDFNRIESGVLFLDEEKVNLRDMVENLAQVCSVTAASNVEITTRIDAYVPRLVSTDPTRLQQILVNLLGNACKFTPSGKNISVHVSVDDSPPPSSGECKLVIRVADEGIGMSQEQVTKLFQPFVQLDVGNKRRYGGSGLGLTISHRLATLMGGGIGVKSEEGQGTEFTVTIMARVAEKDIIVRDDSSHMDIAVLIWSTKRAVRDSCSSKLSHHGFACHSAGDVSLIPKAFTTKPGKVTRAISRRAIICDGVPPPALLQTVDPSLPIVVLKSSVPARSDDSGGYSAAQTVLKPVSSAALVTAVVAACSPSKLPPSNSTKITSPLLRPLPPPGQAAPSTALVNHTSPRISLPAAKQEPHRILIVDDYPANQTLMTLMIRQLGYMSEVAGNGQKAVEMVCAAEETGTPYDAVLMDIHMPVMDGLEATQELRAEGKALPIIALTASPKEEQFDQCMQSGMNGYLSKPVSYQQLRETLAEHIRVSAKLQEH